jgi:hypothetical protein
MKKTVEEYFSLKGRVAVITGGGGELCGCMAEALGALGVRVAVLDLELAKAQSRVEAIRRNGTAEPRLAMRSLPVLRGCSLWKPQFPDQRRRGNDPRGSTTESSAPAWTARTGTGRALELASFRGTWLNFLGTRCPLGFRHGAHRGDDLNMLNASPEDLIFGKAAGQPTYGSSAPLSGWDALIFATANSCWLRRPEDRELAPGQAVIAHTPMGRYGSRRSCSVRIWLLSDASRFVTGALIPIDGGFSSYSI